VAFQLNLWAAAIVNPEDSKGKVPMVCTSLPEVFWGWWAEQQLFQLDLVDTQWE